MIVTVVSRTELLKKTSNRLSQRWAWRVESVESVMEPCPGWATFIVLGSLLQGKYGEGDSGLLYHTGNGRILTVRKYGDKGWQWSTAFQPHLNNKENLIIFIKDFKHFCFVLFHSFFLNDTIISLFISFSSQRSTFFCYCPPSVKVSKIFPWCLHTVVLYYFILIGKSQVFFKRDAWKRTFDESDTVLHRSWRCSVAWKHLCGHSNSMLVDTATVVILDISVNVKYRLPLEMS